MTRGTHVLLVRNRQPGLVRWVFVYARCAAVQMRGGRLELHRCDELVELQP